MSKALTIAVFGARGTGKTQWVLQEIRRQKPKRLMVWDHKHDPGLEGLGTAYHSLPECIRALEAGTFAVRYLPNHGADLVAQFDLFCKAVWAAGNVLLFVDELPEVTKANRAPTAWRKLVNVGREYRGADGKVRHVAIIGAGQRPAECDKSFIANADVVHVGRLGNAADAKEMARSWGVDQRTFMDLPDLHWREKRAHTPEIFSGVLKFSNTAPRVKKSA